MTKPLFEVGEEVILQSKVRPELNGEATVLGVYTDTLLAKKRLNELNPPDVNFIGELTGARYELTITNIRSTGVIAFWAESALRKKHKPSDKSFGELINICNTIEDTV